MYSSLDLNSLCSPGMTLNLGQSSSLSLQSAESIGMHHHARLQTKLLIQDISQLELSRQLEKLTVGPRNRACWCKILFDDYSFCTGRGYTQRTRESTISILWSFSENLDYLRFQQWKYLFLLKIPSEHKYKSMRKFFTFSRAVIILIFILILQT